MRSLMRVSSCMHEYAEWVTCMRDSNERYKWQRVNLHQLLDICLIFSYASIAHVYSSILTS